MNDTQKTRIEIVLQKHKQAIFQCKEVACKSQESYTYKLIPSTSVRFYDEQKKTTAKNVKESSTHTRNLVLLVSICTLVCAIL